MEERNNYWLDIDLTAFRGAGRGTVDAGSGPVDCVIIPVGANWLHVSDRGRVTASVAMYERTDRGTGAAQPDQWGHTHSLRLNAPKDVRQSMSDEERRGVPYVGSAKPMGGASQPASYGAVQSYSPASRASERDEDLPF